MKKKILIGIILLCILGVVLFLVFRKKAENNSGDVIATQNNATYELRSYTTSHTFYMTGPKGYIYDKDRSGTFNSKAEFNKKNTIDTTLVYSFESKEINKYLESIKKSRYDSRLNSDYYKNLTWQDKKTVTVNDKEITYVKLTFNDDSTYNSYIYSISSVFGWPISCEISQYGDSDNFDSDSKLLHDAWEISFNEKD